MASHQISTNEQLREIYPTPSQRLYGKQLDHLDHHCKRFIGLSPFVLLATASSGGRCDVSPKGGPPGFVRVLGERRLLIPDASGNRRIDGLQNIVENPHVGLLFLIPGLGETLRVNGSVTLTRDPELLSGAQTGGRPAEVALVVETEEVFLHCAKALVRSALWQSDTWPERSELPSAAEIFSDHMAYSDVAGTADMLKDAYSEDL